MVILAITAISARSVALGAFGIDSLIEILASTVVVWQLNGTDGAERTVPALRIIAVAFAALAIYIAVQSAIVLAGNSHPPARPDDGSCPGFRADRTGDVRARPRQGRHRSEA